MAPCAANGHKARHGGLAATRPVTPKTTCRPACTERAPPLSCPDSRSGKRSALGVGRQLGRKDRFETYRGRLFGYALALTKDVEAAHELVQDCAIKAFSARSAPKEAAAYRAWLFRVARNLFIDRLRRQRSESTAKDDIELPVGAPLNMEQAVVTALSVREALLRLPDNQREIIVLVDVAGFSYAEVAEVLSVPSGTVMSRLSRARRALIEELTDNKVVPLRPKGRAGGKRRVE